MSCQAKEFGGGFPFEIQDKEGTNRITLTRSHQNEQIEVEVLLPSPANGDAQNGEREDQAEDGKHRSHAGSVAPTYCIPLLVRIHKGAASCLEISCSSYPMQLVVESLEFGSSDGSGGSLSGGIAFRLVLDPYSVDILDSMMAHHVGSRFIYHGFTSFCSDMPEELQKALYPYLRSRGISTDITDFLHAYMINKECHEYLSWLRRLKGLTKS